MKISTFLLLFIFFHPASCRGQSFALHSFRYNNGAEVTGVLLDNYPPVYAIIQTEDNKEQLLEYSNATTETVALLSSMDPLRYGPERMPTLPEIQASSTLYNQLDRVHFKDGKVVTGVVVETYLKDYLVLLWPSGEEWYCYYSDIDSVSSVFLPEAVAFQRFQRYSEGAAIFSSILLPGLGHIYNGEYLKAGAFLGGSLVLTYAAIYFLARSLVIFGPSTPETRQNGNLALISIAAFLSLRIWDVVDAGNTAEEKVDARKAWQKQRCSIRQTKHAVSLELGLAPLPNGAAVGISIRF